MKKIGVALISGLFFLGTAFARYLPSANDIALVDLMMVNIDQLIAVKGDRSAQVVLDTLGSLSSQTVDEKALFILGQTADRVFLSYDNFRLATGFIDENDQDVVVPEITSGASATGALVVDTGTVVQETGVVVPEEVVEEIVTETEDSSNPSGSAQDGPQPIVSEDAISQEPEKESVDESLMIVTTYWFTQDGCFGLSPVQQSVPRTRGLLGATLRTFLAGPTQGQAAWSPIVAPTSLSRLGLSGGVAMVDFNQSFAAGLYQSPCARQSVLDALNLTVIGVAGVNDAIYAINGNVSGFYTVMDLPPSRPLDVLQDLFDATLD